jgi:hypothetical protein
VLVVLVVLVFAVTCGLIRKWIKENNDLKKDRYNGGSEICVVGFFISLFLLVSMKSRKLAYENDLQSS